MVDSQAGSKSQVSKPVVDSQAGSKSQVSKTTEAEADESRENQVSKPAETEAGEPREKSGLASRQGDYAIAEDILDRAVRRLITMEGLTPVVAVEPVVTSRAVGTPVRDEPISLVSRIQIPAPAQTAVRKEIGTLFGKTRISTPAQNPEKVAAPGIPPQPASQPVFQPWENSFWKPEPVQQKLPSTKSTPLHGGHPCSGARASHPKPTRRKTELFYHHCTGSGSPHSGRPHLPFSTTREICSCHDDDAGEE